MLTFGLIICECCTHYHASSVYRCIVADCAADEASETGSDVGDADNSADKDGLVPGTALLSKLHIVTNKVTPAVVVQYLHREIGQSAMSCCLPHWNV